MSRIHFAIGTSLCSSICWSVGSPHATPCTTRTRWGASVVGTDQSEYEGLTGYIYEVRDGADKETENETPDLYCNFDPPDDPAEIAELEAVFSDLYDEPKTLEDIILDCVIMAPDMVRPYQTYRIPVVWESWGVLSIDAGSLEQAAALALDSEMPLPDQKEYVDESIRVDWESVGGCNAPMPDDSADMLCVRGHLGQSE